MKMIKANIAENAKASDRLQLALQNAEDVRDEAAAAAAVLRAAAQNTLGLDDMVEDPPATEAGFNNPIAIYWGGRRWRAGGGRGKRRGIEAPASL